MRTSASRREDCLKIRWLYGAVRFGARKFLFKRTASLLEVEEEELHQSRLCVCTEDLLKSIDSERSLIWKSGSWLAIITSTDGFISLFCRQKGAETAHDKIHTACRFHLDTR